MPKYLAKVLQKHSAGGGGEVRLGQVVHVGDDNGKVGSWEHFSQVDGYGMHAPVVAAETVL